MENDKLNNNRPKRRIVCAVTNDLTTDQRLHKVCYTLHADGFDVTLVGRKGAQHPSSDLPYKTHRFPMWFRKTALFYAEYNVRLFFYLLRSKADIYLANDTDTLLGSYLASKISNKTVVFDAHELFTELPELTNRPTVRFIWAAIEGAFIPHIRHAYTVCQSIALIYKERYGVTMNVVRNTPILNRPPSDTPPPTSLLFLLEQKRLGRRIILYQGMINRGRGIEEMIQAMPLIPNALFCVIGYGDIEKGIATLVENLRLHDRVYLAGRISPSILPQYTSLANLGINLLQPYSLNYYYALPNRTFDYIHANLPMLSSDLPELRAIIDEYGTGTVISDHSPETIAKATNHELERWSNPTNLALLASRFERAKQELNWEKESQTLLSIFREI